MHPDSKARTQKGCLRDYRSLQMPVSQLDHQPYLKIRFQGDRAQIRNFKTSTSVKERKIAISHDRPKIVVAWSDQQQLLDAGRSGNRIQNLAPATNHQKIGRRHFSSPETKHWCHQANFGHQKDQDSPMATTPLLYIALDDCRADPI